MFKWFKKRFGEAKDLSATKMRAKEVTIKTGLVETKFEPVPDENLVHVPSAEETEKYGVDPALRKIQRSVRLRQPRIRLSDKTSRLHYPITKLIWPAIIILAFTAIVAILF